VVVQAALGGTVMAAGRVQAVVAVRADIPLLAALAALVHAVSGRAMVPLVRVAVLAGVILAQAEVVSEFLALAPMVLVAHLALLRAKVGLAAVRLTDAAAVAQLMLTVENMAAAGQSVIIPQKTAQVA
jgi:hypothetical protein